MSTVLVVGSGGREHALAWKLAHSSTLTRLIMAPGNDGWSGFGKDCERWADVDLSPKGFADLAKRARASKVDLAVIGPDNPLADGIVDVLQAEGIRCFGPTAAAARIESSKSFAKEVMKAAGVPTAKYFIAHTAEQARAILKDLPWGSQQGTSGWVVKADGLALGKGVFVCVTMYEAVDAVASLEGTFGPSSPLVIEERLQGEEISWLSFCDGDRCALLEPARDYKRVGNGDRGSNTGGMGAFSPVPGISAEFSARIRDEVFLPTLREMKRRGVPFRGVLYAGLMADLANKKFWVLEFNARFGDPETQVLMTRLEDDLLRWCDAVAKGDIRGLPEAVSFSKEAAVVVVGAAGGYPDSPEKGKPVKVSGTGNHFWAGVKKTADGTLVTSGGRVVGAVGKGPTLSLARDAAYRELRKISFEGLHFRTDIAAIGGAHYE